MRATLILIALLGVGCDNRSPLAPTTGITIHTADIDPPLQMDPAYEGYTVSNFPDWVCRAKFVQDPGPEFWNECKRRGL